MIKKVDILDLTEHNANHIIPSYWHVPVSCRSLVDRCGSLGSCNSQIKKYYYCCLGGSSPLQPSLWSFVIIAIRMKYRKYTLWCNGYVGELFFIAFQARNARKDQRCLLIRLELESPGQESIILDSVYPYLTSGSVCQQQCTTPLLQSLANQIRTSEVMNQPLFPSHE